ncbi:MAG: hypothetical protein KC561_09480, partial [Myxococcales bacterium]|nr:hypothetical protein [Myxococcales bacterium]
LGFNPTPPAPMPTVLGGQSAFRQISTLSSGSARVEILDVEARVERFGEAFADGGDLTEVTFSEPLPPEEAYLFGQTLLTLKTTYPEGSYEGELWITTDRSSAPLMVFGFSASVGPAPEDMGGNAEVVEAAPDAAPDMGTEVVEDVTSDLGTGEDTSADISDDTGEPTPTPEQPKDEGCSQPGVSGTPFLGLVMLALWSVVRRRSARVA